MKDTPSIPTAAITSVSTAKASTVKASTVKVSTAKTSSAKATTVPSVSYDLHRKHIPCIDLPPSKDQPYPNPAGTYVPTSATREIT
ncbi:predicted protein [Histoplasma mississippiense (nom. inval.)]|uniref:predicted protein n=1 Tax=Ajellomyces capsulatus (strain NAm1 / WU24) TaxID=2059318 RepID=UPI000157D5E5|nr:predicted protein [Histoplasma mississippiense (nom. inval.)]EDN05358.1 predicted protein [Histoplasma mississippiense (nom. inval.)]